MYDKLPVGLTAIERVILTNKGPVQDLISLVFNSKCRVRVISQQEYHHNIIRITELVCADKSIGIAKSVIPIDKNTPGFVNGILEKTFGIGELLSSVDAVYTRDIIQCYSNTDVVIRTYTLSGNDIAVMITETFSRRALSKIE